MRFWGGLRSDPHPVLWRELELVGALPEEGSFLEVMAALTAKQVDEIVATLEETYVALSFPRFELHSSVPLKQELMARGMTMPFSEAAGSPQSALVSFSAVLAQVPQPIATLPIWRKIC